jgi:hypothetical protein
MQAEPAGRPRMKIRDPGHARRMGPGAPRAVTRVPSKNL